jgi:uncharacterized delta-60 repeat protein
MRHLPLLAVLTLPLACGDDSAAGTLSATDSDSDSGATTTTTTTTTTAASESEAGSATAGACTPGQSSACLCPSGDPGLQICDGEGAGYGPCECSGVCGDGVQGAGEACDDGPSNADDAACTSACQLATCGDGLVHAGVEACDDGVNDGGYGGCVPGCAALGPRCGDSVTNGREACDDGDPIDGNGCNVDCLLSGAEIWTERYTGRDAGDAIAHGVAVDLDGNVIVVGEEFVVGQSANIWIAKYTAAGALLWSQSVVGAGAGIDIARGVAVAPDGAIVVVGQLAVQGQGTDLWLRKLDGAGKELWTRAYNGKSNLGDSGNAVAIDTYGEIYVAGDEYQLIGLSNALVRKYSPAGDLLWSDTYDHELGNDYARAIALTPAGDPVVVGSVYEPLGLAELWVRKYASDGVLLWSRAEDFAAGNDIGRGVAVDPTGDILLTGEIYAPIGLANILVRRLSGDGDLIWEDVYDSKGSDNDIGRAIAISPDGTIVVAGQEYTANDFAGVWVRKYTAEGAAWWTHSYDGPGAGDDIARAAAIAPNGSIYAAGQEYMVGQFATLWLRKLTP